MATPLYHVVAQLNEGNRQEKTSGKPLASLGLAECEEKFNQLKKALVSPPGLFVLERYKSCRSGDSTFSGTCEDAQASLCQQGSQTYREEHAEL